MLIDFEIYLRSVSFLQPDPSPSSSVEKVRREAKEQVFLKFYFRASPSGLNISLVVFHLLSCFILFPFTLIYSFVRSPVFLPRPSRAQTTEVISLKSCHMRPDITNHKYRPDNAFEINLSITSACKGWLLPLKSSISVPTLFHTFFTCLSEMDKAFWPGWIFFFSSGSCAVDKLGWTKDVGFYSNLAHLFG